MSDKKKSEEFDFDATASAIPEDIAKKLDPETSDSEEESSSDILEAYDNESELENEDINATQMTIDVDSINFDNTRTDVKIDLPTDEEIIQEKLEQKKSFFSKFFSTIFKKSSQKTDKKPKSIPQSLSALQGIWICDPEESAKSRLSFYAIRIFILIFSILAQYLFIKQTAFIFFNGHPAKYVFLISFILQLFGIGYVVYKKKSPSWVFVLPVITFILQASYGAIFYHLADPLLFSVFSVPVSFWLNELFLGAIVLVLLLTILSIRIKSFYKLLLIVVSLLASAPLIYNLITGKVFEMAFFDNGFLSALPFFLKPQYILVHYIFLGCSLFFLFLLFFHIKGHRRKVERGFLLSFAVLYFSLTIFGISLLQKNRIWHVFNLVLPMTLDSGSVEIEVFNQKLRLETKNFSQNQGSDLNSRYRFILEPTKTKGTYLLQSVDQFGFPVRNLSKNDLLIFSDDKKITNFKLIEQFDEKGLKKFVPKGYKIRLANRGMYLLKVNLQNKDPLITWKDIPRNLTTKDRIEFKINDISKAKKFAVYSQSNKVLEQKVINPNMHLELFYFKEGENKIHLIVYDDSDQEIYKKDLVFSLKKEADLAVISPVMEDTIDDSLSIVLSAENFSPKDVKKVEYFINDILFYTSNEFARVHQVSTESLSEGFHDLKIKLQLGSKVFEKSVKFRRRIRGPQLEIISPQMGAFSPYDLQVTYKFVNKKPSYKVAGIKVFVDGNAFDNLKIEEGSFELPLSRWSDSEIYITVQASFENGERLSDWVQINKGQGKLSLEFDKKSLSFLHYSRISFILDASISFYDNWLGASKWKNIQKIITHPNIESKIEYLNPNFIVFGNKKPHYFKDCGDASVLVKDNRYNKTEIGRILDRVKPKGVSALGAAYAYAIKQNPQKIFVFTDNTDLCAPNLQKVFKKSVVIPTDIFVLGDIRKQDLRQLEDFTKYTSGKFFQPTNFESLIHSLEEQLVLMYQVYLNDKLILESPFANDTTELVPGQYNLRLGVGEAVQNIPFEVKNGYTTKLNITGDSQNKKIKIQESFQKN